MANYVSEYIDVDGVHYDLAMKDHKNLLDNAWFTVNQRGATTVQPWSIGVDRWASGDTAHTVNGSTLTIPSGTTVSQTLEGHDVLYGNTLTVSVLFTDGVIESGTFTNPSSVIGGTVTTVFVGNRVQVETALKTDENSWIRFKNISTSSISIMAVKLEYGTVSTLALDHEPNYSEELLKCKRYFIIADGDPVTGYVFTDKKAWFKLDIAQKMREKPVMINASTAKILNGSNGTIATGLEVYKMGETNVALRTTSATSLTAGSTFSGYIQVTDYGSGIPLSADL